MTRRLPMLPSASHHDLAEHCVFPWNGGVRWPDRAPMAPEQRYGSALHALAEVLVCDAGAEIAEMAARFEVSSADTRRLEDARAQLLAVLRADAGDHREAEVPFVYAIATGAIRRATSHKDRDAGEVYIGGQFAASITFGQKQLNAGGDKDGFLAQLAGGTGAPGWSVATGSVSMTTSVTAVAVAPVSGNIAYAGLVTSTMKPPPLNSHFVGRKRSPPRSVVPQPLSGGCLPACMRREAA